MKNLIPKPPKHVKIGYKKYELVPISNELSNEKEVLGEISYSENQIVYHGEKNIIDTFNIILHECLHGIMHQSGVPIEIDKSQEFIVESIANGISAMLIDSKELLEYLISVLEIMLNQSDLLQVTNQLQEPYLDESEE